MSEEEPTGRIERLNGIQLYFEVHGGGAPLLLLHGFSGSSQDWRSIPADWREHFQLIVPDLRGHGRSSVLTSPFRHRDAAADLIALLDHLKVDSVAGLGISGGGNILLHLATRQPERVKAMVIVSATPYFPAQARTIMRQYPESVNEAQRDLLRRRHPQGDPQIKMILESTRAFAESHDDLNFTPPLLATIQARTLIVQGDRGPLYPVELSVELARAVPQSSLWIVPDAGHGPVIGDRWPEFLRVASAFLRK